MKVAIIQEWLVTIGGSDKVVKAIYDVFPNADIYTLVAKKEICEELCPLVQKNIGHICHYSHLQLSSLTCEDMMLLFPHHIVSPRAC